MKLKFLNAFVIALMLFQAIAPIGALAYTAADQTDYAPGAVVTISGDNSDGAGFAAGEAIHVEVSGPNGFAASCDATADDNAAWWCQVTLTADAAEGSYSYLATSATSGVTQSGEFTVTAPATPEPTQEPTQAPTAEPTQPPTAEPTQPPTVEPTSQPTTEPTASPTVELSPTAPAVLTPFITSDKEDYAPGEKVTLTSGNWQPGESVHLVVNDTLGDSWRISVDVSANGTGGFVYQFNLPNWFVAQYHVYAYGAISGSATWDFTDSQPASVALTPTSVTVAPGSAASYTEVKITKGGNS
ncbi:MAG TPA: hypothetical protein VK909_14305, partial [Anaerolineales bacterium]|nr:hypothetical protein [Anaerolineales bacterium]